VAAVQPYRFLIPAVLFLIAPATVGLVWAARQIMGAARGVRVAALLLLLAAGPTFTGYLLDLTWRPLPCGLTAAQRESLAGLKRLPVRGRVLSDDLMLSHVIPCFCRLPVIGGLSTQAFLKHRFAGMDNHGRFFGRPCSEWKADDLKAYLDAYAVEYAAFSRPDWLAFAEREPGLFEPVETTDYWRVFRVRAPSPSLVLSGEAEASASFAGIGVRSCRSAEVILKLHYAEWLAADAGVRLEPVQVLDDPVPFIRAVVPAGVQSFRIAARGRRRPPPAGG
jgi:hypothetical protein